MTDKNLPQLAKEFIRLTDTKNDLSGETKDIQKLLDKLAFQITEAMNADDVTKLSVGDRTVFMSSEMSVSTNGDMEGLVDACRGEDMEWMFGVNMTKFKAWIKEQPTDKNLNPVLPNKVSDACTINRYTRLNCRRA